MNEPLTLNQSIARNIRILRDARQIRQRDLMEHMEINQSAGPAFERGEMPFTLELLIRIANVLNTTPGRLIDGPITNRMIDITDMADDAAAALENMAEILRR